METRRNSPLIQRLPLALAILCLPALATAQATSAQDTGMHDAVQSRISQVKVFPGSATVERVASVRAGSRSITFHCLPAGLDVQSLQVSSDTPLRVGETTVSSEPRAHSPACADSPLDARIRALEDRKAALDAEHQALAYVTGMFQGLAGTGDKRASVDVRELASASETIRRTGQASLLRQYQIDRQRTDLDRELQPLLAERTRSQGGDDAMVTRVSITLEPPARSTDVRLSYQVSGPGWTPSYRAMLDTGSGRLRIERQALVAQATGEDWSGVKLVLSTGQPRRNTAAATPSSWQLGALTPMPQAEQMNLARMPSPPAPPAAIALTGSRRQAIAAQPLFEAGVFDGSFATEFALPQSLDVPSNGQRVSMLLDSHELEAKIAVRISPAIEAAGYLIAEVHPPQGVWPAGPLQLYRDGAFVGSGRWSTATGVAADAPQTLWFGRDELLRVSAEPPQDTRTTAGFGGGRSERHLQRAYLIENRHRDRIDIQVLEAAPVSSDAQIRVSTRFSPTPAETAWNRQPGVAMWRQSLAAGQSARFSAEHTVSYPKELMIEGL